MTVVMHEPTVVRMYFCGSPREPKQGIHRRATHSRLQRVPVLLDVVLQHQPGHLPHGAVLVFQHVEYVAESRIISGYDIKVVELLLNGTMLCVGGALRRLE